jgi:serine/threonine-protein kinase RsbT
VKTVESELGAILTGSISEITRRAIFRRLGSIARQPLHQLSQQDRSMVQAEIESSVRLFAPARSNELIALCARVLSTGLRASAGSPAAGASRPGAEAAAGASAPARPFTAAVAAAAATRRFERASRVLAIDSERDIAAARLEAWSEAVRIGLSKFASVKVATAVSELARNIVFYAGTGSIDLHTRDDGRSVRLEIIARDRGPGIDAEKLASIFGGTYRSERGLGKGLVAVQKLTDDFEIDTGPGRGTTVTCVFRSEA